MQRSGYEFVEDDNVVADTITSVARGETGYENLVEWFRARLARPGDVIVTEKTEDDEENVNELGLHGSGRPIEYSEKSHSG